MTIQWGDTGKVVVGPLKTFNISINPNENLLGTAQSLGTATPTGGAAGDISYTIQAADLPTISPASLSVKYTAYLIIAGQNNSGASVTLTYNVLKNGASVASNQTQTGVTNANYWTHTHFRWYDVKVGDTLEVQTWSSATGVTLMYWAVVILPTRIGLTKCDIVKDYSFTLGLFNLTKGNPSQAAGYSFDYYPTENINYNLGLSTNDTLKTACISATNTYSGYALGIVDRGDRITGTQTNLSTTNYPYYVRNYVPTQVSFREVLR